MDKEVLIAMILKRIDVKGILVEDILNGVIYKKIDELVLKSDNTLDDAIAAMLKPLLSAEVDKYVAELLAKYSGDIAV